MSQLEIVLSEKCRVCLNTGGLMYPLFLKSHKDESISDLIYSLTHIEIPWVADLPENICEKCRAIVIEFDKLILMFKRNTECLQNLLIKRKTKSRCINDNNVLDRHLRKKSISKVVPPKNLSSKSHNTIEIECDLCHEVFMEETEIQHHQCTASDADDSKVDTTTIIENDNDFEVKDDPDNPDELCEEDQLSKSTKRYTCKYCKESYDEEHSLKEHTKIHRTFICDQCGAAFFRKAYLLDHKFTHTSEKRFSCEKCGKQFKYRSGLRVHETVHINYRGFVCDVCAASFNTKTTLNTHILLKHKNEKKFKCTECNLSFKLNSWLRKHFMRKHSGNRTKNFVCTYCGVSYLNKTTLTRHIEEKHSGPQRRYPCNVCDKTYASTTKLNLHLNKIHCYY
ncbi:unnamed protein product [Callosobruchus maculatus]|uniref:Protein krueppel n=1 Tax=Callosobruchus maculatus TaxID=64391 RepID=A0A653CG53_CALMS|nr:unnamed protein product [Callosobruchus maculatus]